MNRFRFLALAAVLAGLSFSFSASAQTVSVISGNGQILAANNFNLRPLVVQVTDSTTGAPVGAGVEVDFVSSGVQGVFLATGNNSFTTTTDANGQASAFFSLPYGGSAINFLSPIAQTNVTVTAKLNNVVGNPITFTLTQVLGAPNVSIQPTLQVQEIAVPEGSTLTGAIGTTAAPIKLQVNATNGQATSVVPNAAVALLNYQDPSTGAVVSCAPDANTALSGLNVVLTDSTGTATCTPVFRGQAGQGRFSVTVGGIGSSATADATAFWELPSDPTDPNTLPPPQTAWVNFNPIRINATAGVAATITAKSGGNQSANPGQALASPLVVEVDSTTGAPQSGVTVNWRVTPAGSANLSSTTTSDSTGRTSNAVTVLGNATGTITVTASLASDPTKTATFTINVVPPVSVTGFTIVSGNNQSASTGIAFPSPLVVQVTTSNGIASNIPVQFAVTSGSVVLSATTVQTDANGRAQVNATAGNVTGNATVLATVASNNGIGSQTFTLVVAPQAPPITGANFVNGADAQKNSLSPCSLGAIVIPANSLGVQSASPSFPGQPLASPLQLLISNVNAPILNISNSANGQQQQILFQVPCEAAPGTSVPGSLSISGGAAANLTLSIQPASPGIFQTQMSDGVSRAVIIRPDGSFVTLANPARRGETVVALVTGLGPTTPAVGTGSVPAPGGTATVNGDVIVGMAGGGVPLTYAKLSEDLPGVYVVAFQVPTDVTTGNDVTFSIGLIPTGAQAAIYSATTKIPIR